MLAINKKKFIINNIIFIGLTFIFIILTYSKLETSIQNSELIYQNVSFFGILSKNLMVCIIAILGIYTFKISAFIILIVNPIVLGSLLGINWLTTNELIYFLKILIPHGIIEIPALCLACTIGMEGRSFLKKYTLKQIIATFMLLIIMLILAAWVETYISVLLV